MKKKQPIIVLKTHGKNEEVITVKVKLFEKIEEAEKYCEENTDFIQDKKYWDYCEIIKEGTDYKPARYRNYEILF